MLHRKKITQHEIFHLLQISFIGRYTIVFRMFCTHDCPASIIVDLDAVYIFDVNFYANVITKCY